MGNLSEVGESLSILVVNLAGLLTGGVLTLFGARVWARRIETGRAIFRPTYSDGGHDDIDRHPHASMSGAKAQTRWVASRHHSRLTASRRTATRTACQSCWEKRQSVP
jgi:hypothetical protein